MKHIPLVGLFVQYQQIKPEVDLAIKKVINTSAFVGGDEVRAFEEEFARYCQVDHCVGVANGTDAIELTLRALGIGSGHEVITSPLTFFATAEAILNVGAQPVFVDVAADTGLMRVDRLRSAITSRTKAIVAVHLYGQPCDMGDLASVARGYRLRLIGDAAQAHGALWRGRPIATYADATTFSFYPGKNLGALGDAGAVVTANQALAADVRRLANHGREEKYIHSAVGRNSRLDTLQAAVLSLKLARLAEWNARRVALAEQYRERLRALPVCLPSTAPGACHVWHFFTIRTRERDRLKQALAGRGIETGIHYPVPLHLQPAMAGRFAGAHEFPIAEQLAATTLSLPLYPELSDDAQREIVDTIAECLLSGDWTDSAPLECRT